MKESGFVIKELVSRAGAAAIEWKLADEQLKLSFELKATQKDTGIATEFQLTFPETKLKWQEDGSYRAAADMTVTGTVAADECSGTANFTASVDVVGRPVDPNDQKVFRFEFTPKEPTHPAVLKCPELSLTLQWPVATWLRAPSKTPVTVGQPTPVAAELLVETLRANIDATMKLVREPLKP